ncbi:recombinase family protein [Ruminococcus sp. NK3A76]|uniref:recombinase family protein n=1 Tax=Ruminococcus sp. NK3A76 TaxID=877411 RepID=UPI0005670D31|nr:recombinase family protein [Ruminococcus sp. NK3A76]
MADTRKFAIYSRKSKFTGKGESIENQIEMCTRELKATYHITDDDIVVFEDEGYSGGNTNRPQFQEMIKRCHEGEFRLVICYRLDRISRNTADFVKTYEELKANNVSFRSVSDNIDDTSPMGKAMMMISSVFAQLERDIITERITDNMRELAKTGRWLGGNPPTGYESVGTVGSVTVDGKIHKAQMLRQKPEEIEIVKTIYDKFLELRSITKVETYLLNSGVKTKTGINFSRFAIKTILQNPVYLINDSDAYAYFKENDMQVYADESDFDGKNGVLAYNKTLQITGKSIKQKDRSEWIIAVGKHKSVIPGSKWAEAQHLLGLNKSKSYRRQRSNEALLSGLLFCADCGSYMRPKLSSRVNKRGERVYDYLCEMKEKSHGKQCNMKRINGNDLDEQVIDEIKKLGADSSELMKLLCSSRKDLTESFTDFQSEIDKRLALKKKTEGECANLVNALTLAGESGAADDIIKKLNSLHEQIDRLDMEIAEYSRLIDNGKITDESFQSLAEMLTSFADNIDGLNVMQKRDLIRCFVSRVEWDGENVHIYILSSDKAPLTKKPLSTGSK